jgi:hypothetical protein
MCTADDKSICSATFCHPCEHASADEDIKCNALSEYMCTAADKSFALQPFVIPVNTQELMKISKEMHKEQLGEVCSFLI